MSFTILYFFVTLLRSWVFTAIVYSKFEAKSILYFMVISIFEEGGRKIMFLLYISSDIFCFWLLCSFRCLNMNFEPKITSGIAEVAFSVFFSLYGFLPVFYLSFLFFLPSVLLLLPLSSRIWQYENIKLNSTPLDYWCCTLLWKMTDCRTFTWILLFIKSISTLLVLIYLNVRHWRPLCFLTQNVALTSAPLWSEKTPPPSVF